MFFGALAAICKGEGEGNESIVSLNQYWDDHDREFTGIE